MKHIVFLSAVLGAASSAPASILLTVQAGFFREADGVTLVAPGSVAALVVDTSGNGFGGIADLDGATVAQGNFWDDDYVLGTFSANADSSFNDSFSGIIYSGALSEGDAIGFYWFPELSSIGGTLSADMSWGFYRTEVVDGNSGADIAFRMPTDGFDYTLAFFENTLAPGALATPANFTAMAGAAAVPEASTFALFASMAGLLAAGFRRPRGRGTARPASRT